LLSPPIVPLPDKPKPKSSSFAPRRSSEGHTDSTGTEEFNQKLSE